MRKVPYDKNLLSNPSFEKHDGGVPEGWHIGGLRGLKGEKEASYGIDTTTAYAGESSFFFRGEKDTKRWFILSQEVRVTGATHIRLRGAIKVDKVIWGRNQYRQCNFLLTFLDKSHNRFQMARFADKKTQLRSGSSDWIVEEQVYRLPKRTSYVVVSCVLGMSGTVWFDDISLEVPEPIHWNRKKTKNFDFFSLSDKDFPEGSMENQQRLFDYYCSRLGVKDDGRIGYYLYPDSTLIYKIMSYKGSVYVSWDDREIHTIYPNNDHQIIHMITDPYGKPPTLIAEGTVFFLNGDREGKPLHILAKEFLLSKRLPPLKSLIEPDKFGRIKADVWSAATGSFVGYLAEMWGVARLLELYRESSGLMAYETFAKAFKNVYGLPLPEVEQKWRRFLTVAKFAAVDTTGAR